MAVVVGIGPLIDGEAQASSVRWTAWLTDGLIDTSRFEDDCNATGFAKPEAAPVDHIGPGGLTKRYIVPATGNNAILAY